MLFFQTCVGSERSEVKPTPGLKVTHYFSLPDFLLISVSLLTT